MLVEDKQGRRGLSNCHLFDHLPSFPTNTAFP